MNFQKKKWFHIKNKYNYFKKYLIMEWSSLKPINLSKIEIEEFPEEKIYKYVNNKKQIVLHHTVSNPNDEKGDIRWWTKDMKHIATCIIITSNGVPHQLFSSKYWSHHLGIPKSFIRERGFKDYETRNVKLNEESISIEIDNWGGLEKINKNLYKNVYGRKLKILDKDVQYFPNRFRGYYYYQKYTKEQIKTVGELLLFWNKKYDIPLEYNNDMWDVSNNAIGGKSGVWSHVSYRKHNDKQDCFPDENLIKMLKSLSKIVNNYE